jgi:hypothetical protein
VSTGSMQRMRRRAYIEVYRVALALHVMGGDYPPTQLRGPVIRSQAGSQL